jgi:two-component system cell cycle response regulator CtrA
MRVLLVEDDPNTAKSIEMMLTHANLNVYCTDMGEEGIDLAKLYDYDLILLDLNLPDMTGHEVLRQLRLARITTPILILSGTDDTESKIRGFGFGADDYLTKPFHREELIARIHAIIRRSKGHSQSIIRTGKIACEPGCKNCRGRWGNRAFNGKRIPDARAAFPAQRHNPNQRDVFESSLRWDGRA